MSVNLLQQSKKELSSVMVAKKSCHKGALFGHVSNGGGRIDLGNGFSLQFIAHNEKFCSLQLFKHGLDQTVETQSWQKSKKVIKADDQAPLTEFKSDEEELL